MTNKQAFIAKIQLHQAIINKLLFLYADNPEDRRDLRQEILYQAWRSYKSFRGEAKFSTWLYRVGLYVSITHLRRNKKSAPIVTDFAVEQPSTQSASELLEKILSLMNPVEKSIILLLVEGYQQQEIAEMLGISGENTRVKIHRIRKKLNQYGISKFVE